MMSAENRNLVDFAERLHDLMEEYGISASEAESMLHRVSREDAHQRIIAECEENQAYVGRFFVNKNYRSDMAPVMKRFYKVISARSSSRGCVECLVVDEHPSYWFNYQDHKLGLPGDYYLGTFEFESIHVESVPLRDLLDLKEITSEEYTRAMIGYTTELLDAEWPCEHLRLGRKGAAAFDSFDKLFFMPRSD